MAARALGRLSTRDTAFFLCDMQERFRSTISYFPSILATCQRLTAAADILKLPVITTEQYPERLGATCSELLSTAANRLPALPKTSFSMCGEPRVIQQLTSLQPPPKSIVLFGIEAHVCVLQTALHLLERDYDVHLVVDAVSSRSMVDRKFAIERMKQSGVFLTTTESLIFQLMGDAKHPDFKALQKLIKEVPPDSGLLEL